MTAPTMAFHASFDGEDDREFATLQSAMAWAEDLGHNQTGTISFQGDVMIRYEDGEISAEQPTG